MKEEEVHNLVHFVGHFLQICYTSNDRKYSLQQCFSTVGP
jgi:hypothetical protein